MSTTIFRDIWDKTRPAWAQPSARWRVLLVMAALADDTGETIETVGRIADLAGISARQTQRYLSDLQAAGFVSVTEPGRGQGVPSVYRVSIPSVWEPPRTGAWWELPADS